MDKKLEKIIDLKLDASDRDAERHGLIQYNYGQILRIHGLDLPPAVEIQFSYREKGGVTENRIGTTKDGVTEVQIPDAMLKNNGTTQDYAIWVFIYVTDETSGNTVYRIKVYVDSRPAPGEIGEDPEEKRILDEAVNAVNAAAERAETAEAGARSAADSATAAAESARKSAEAVAQEKNTAISAIQNQQTAAEKAITDHTDTEIGRLDRETQESEDRLTETIRTANDTKEAAENTISEARRVKESLDISVQNATKEKEAVEASTSTANAAKKNLDQSTADANVAKTALDKTIQSADDQNTSLGEKIETSKQLKTDLQTAGEKATQDIQTAGSEQLGKMQAVAEEFTADREQIATNKEDIGDLKDKKITKFYASNRGENHLADSDNGKIMDMMLYGRSEQKQYKGINLFPPNTEYREFVEVSIPKGTKVFAIADGIIFPGGNFRFFNADKTESMWFGLDKSATAATSTLRIDAKYVQNLLPDSKDLSKICLGIGSEPIYEPYTGGIPSPSPDYPQQIKSVVNPTVKVSNEDGAKSQTVTLPYTLNAIPVSSGGNVTIDGQQYIADRVVEKDGVFGVERNTATDVPVLTKKLKETPDLKGRFMQDLAFEKTFTFNAPLVNIGYGTNWGAAGNVIDKWIFGVNNKALYISPPKNLNYTSEDIFNALKDLNIKVYGALLVPFFEPLPGDIQAKLRTLVANYPVTNITVTSDQLDGYIVFSYPISMANGWNYVKKQLGDTRDYIYDMDAKAQDIDIQSAEAYVNSEYAVALTELEV